MRVPDFPWHITALKYLLPGNALAQTKVALPPLLHI
jgi:hypothetical protein